MSLPEPEAGGEVLAAVLPAGGEELAQQLSALISQYSPDDLNLLAEPAVTHNVPAGARCPQTASLR